MCSAQKISLPIRAMKTKMYLPESPFFKNSLAGASGLVLMSNPAVYNDTGQDSTKQRQSCDI